MKKQKPKSKCRQFIVYLPGDLIDKIDAVRYWERIESRQSLIEPLIRKEIDRLEKKNGMPFKRKP